MKKVLAVLLSVLLLGSSFAVAASAAATGDSGSFSALCYNVAGLPDVSFVTGEEARDVPANQTTIGKFVSEQKYDIFAVQEDFGYHDILVKALPDYKYKTSHHGGVPVGDGTNTFTRTFPMYDEAHIVWNQLYGIADDGADEFSQKGITYTCIEIAKGVYVDFYNLHADAYGDAGSLAARQDNFRQLAALINSRSVNRPVIVTGDFNAFVYQDASGLKETLVDGAGLKDAWVELYNGGNYDDCEAFLAEYGESWTNKWGVWDSVERFMYKDGEGVSLTCDSFRYVDVKNSDGKSCSDHMAAEATFSYAVTGELPAEKPQTSKGSLLTGLQEAFRRIITFFKALFMGFSNLDKVKEYFDKTNA